MARYPTSGSPRGSGAPDASLLPARARRQLVFWCVLFALFVLFLFVFRDILLPFIAGAALAYFLDPVADRLERWGLSRTLAATLILLVFLFLFAIALLLIAPVLSQQFLGLLERMPGYVQQLRTTLADVEAPWFKRLVGEGRSGLQENLNAVLTEGAQWLGAIFTRIWSGGRALVDVVSLLVVTPIVAFYLLLDWDRMVARLDGWIPPRNRETVRSVMRDMDRAIAGFVRGQGTVCLVLGTFYAAALTGVGLNFGLLIGMFAGLISFIPFVGSIVGFVLAVGVALVQFWPDFFWIAVVGGVFVLGQFLEGNFLQPKLVGQSVGLHPVWLMFALLAFGALLGFTGLLIAVPAAAAIGVLVRFALTRYLASDFYGEVDEPGLPEGQAPAEDQASIDGPAPIGGQAQPDGPAR